MKRHHLIYGIYLAFCILLVGSIIITPLLALSNSKSADAIYSFYSFTCHQKLSRSNCLFDNSGALSFDDCTNQTGVFVENQDEKNTSAVKGSVIGYKFPVCARDVGIYGMMLVGAIIYPFLRKLDSKSMYSPWFLVAALIPIGIDGTAQLLGFYESTNLLRLLTGGLAGFVMSLYIIPVLNKMFNE